MSPPTSSAPPAARHFTIEKLNRASADVVKAKLADAEHICAQMDATAAEIAVEDATIEHAVQECERLETEFERAHAALHEAQRQASSDSDAVAAPARGWPTPASPLRSCASSAASCGCARKSRRP